MPGRWRHGLAAAVLLGLCPGALARDEPVQSDRWTRKYDQHFRKYSKHYFGPGFDWHWFKAQAIAESTLNPTAKSPRGARGLMQILPSTFEEIQEKNPHFVDIDTPRWNIAAGIYYDRALYRRWDTVKRNDRLYFALASYNAGYVRILRIRERLAEADNTWAELSAHVPAQTRHYVRRIRRLTQPPRAARDQADTGPQDSEP